MRIYCDIWSGQLRRSLDGGILGPLRFYMRDILTMELVFVDGTEMVTTTVLAGGALLKIGIKSKPGTSAILALMSEYTLNGQIAVGALSLATAEMASYFTDSAPSNTPDAPLYFEIEVTAADQSARQTYHQSACLINREVNQSTDGLPTVDLALYVLIAALFDGAGRGVSPFYAAFRGEVTALTGNVAGTLDHITTTILTVPTCFIVRIAGVGGVFVLENDAVTVADGVYIVDPADFNAVTNARKWKKII